MEIASTIMQVVVAVAPWVVMYILIDNWTELMGKFADLLEKCTITHAQTTEIEIEGEVEEDSEEDLTDTEE